MESENEKDEDEEADGASNSGHVRVHRRRKVESVAVISSTPGSKMDLSSVVGFGGQTRL